MALLKKKNKKKASPKDIIITVALIIVLGTVGYFVFESWQSASKVLETAAITEIQLPSSGQQAQRTPLETADPNYLWIPDRNIETPIQYVDEANEEIFQKALENGVVHYPGTALPGEFGNPYLFGHSSDYLWKAGDYKQVLKELIDIPTNTEVRITNPDGELFIFRVIETKIVGPKEVSVLDQQNHERQLLTVQTSWPLGTALKRYIAVCEIDEEATYGPEETN